MNAHPIQLAERRHLPDERPRVAHRRPRWACIAGVVLLAAAGGCGGAGAGGPRGVTEAQGGPVTSELAPATASSVDDESMADLRDHHLHHHGGFAMFVAMGLAFLNTTPEQRGALSDIQAAMDVETQPVRDAERGVLIALADGTAAGKIDRERVDAAIGGVTTAAARAHDQLAGTLNQLHALLTPPQRMALIDKIDAHFAVWRDVNSADPSTDPHGGRLGKLTQELDLSPDQVEQVRASLQGWRDREIVHLARDASEYYLEAFEKAFVGEGFDARMLDTGPTSANMAAWGLARMASFYEAVCPSLTPDQRNRLADLLRWHASYKRPSFRT
jgi:Spy/CpxP family protein refolding chaperone